MTARHARPARGRPRVPPAVMRLGVRQLGRRCLDPALPWSVQRTWLDQLTRTSLLPRGTTVTQQVQGRRSHFETVGQHLLGGQPHPRWL